MYKKDLDSLAGILEQENLTVEKLIEHNDILGRLLNNHK